MASAKTANSCILQREKSFTVLPLPLANLSLVKNTFARNGSRQTFAELSSGLETLASSAT